MKRIALSLALFAAAAASLSAQKGEVLEQILVKVNGDIITKTDLEQRQIGALRQKDPQFRPGTDTELQKALLDVTPEVIVNAVDELLLVQRGKELGYTLGAEQFRRIVENIKKENKIETEEQFQAALKQEGMTLDDLRRQLERQMLISQVQQAEVAGKISVAEEEVKKYYERAPRCLYHPATTHPPRDPDQLSQRPIRGSTSPKTMRRGRRRKTCASACWPANRFHVWRPNCRILDRRPTAVSSVRSCAPICRRSCSRKSTR